MSSSSSLTSRQDALDSEVDQLVEQYLVKKEGEEVHRRANVIRSAAAHVGIETPVTVLVDVRSALEELVRVTVESERAADARHQQVCKILLSIAKDRQRDNLSRESSFLGGAPDEKSSFYCGSTRLSSGHHLIGACVMTLSGVVDRYDQTNGDGTPDTVTVDIKEWSSLSKILLGCESKVTGTRGVVTPPKPSSPDFPVAAGFVSSTVPGRIVTCDISHIYELCRMCPSVAGCMKAFLDRLLLCPGLVSAERHMKLSRLRFPFAVDEATLNIGNPGPRPAVAIVQTVQKAKHDARKRYVEGILKDGWKASYSMVKATSD